MTSIHPADFAVPHRTSDETGVREETSLFGFANILLKYRGMIAAFVILFGGFGVVKYMNARPVYITRVGVNVEASQTRSEGSGAASQLSFLTGASGPAQAVALFSELLRSPAVLRQAAKGPYTVRTAKGAITGPLGPFYGYSGPPALYQEEMVTRLTDGVKLSGSNRTGNLWIFVEAPYPDLSKQIADNLINQLDDYTRKRRRAQAAAEREFVSERLDEARTELRLAEEQVVNFQGDNRIYSSPALLMANSRLQRDVAMKQQLYTGLIQSYDRARIEEARNLPALTLLDSSDPPVKPERSSAASLPLLSAITGMLIAIIIAFIRERMAETAAAPTEAFDTYLELKREALGDLRNPLRPLGRAVKPRPDG